MANHNPWNGQERRKDRLTDDDIEKIAERAKGLVQDAFAIEVGKITIRILLYALGAGCLALLAWLGLTEKIRLP